MIERCLIIHEFEDFSNVSKLHFSSTKGFFVAQSLSKYVDVSYLTTGKSEVNGFVKLKNLDELRKNDLESFDLIILTREHVFPTLISKFPEMMALMRNKNRKTIILHKGDSFGWIKQKEFRNSYYNLAKKTVFKDISMLFDVICAQTEELANTSFSQLPKEVCEKIQSKIFISRMGVPNEAPNLAKPNSKVDFFANKMNYCVDDYPELTSGKALYPLCFTTQNKKETPENFEKFLEQKTRLIYMGRMKTDGGRIIDLMKKIMIELGDDFELHIFPGRFRLPGVPVSVFSPKSSKNLQLIRDRHFAECKNVIIHYPFESSKKSEILRCMDIGIDFCQFRPENKKSSMGNAKLLEYCYYGLKVVIDENINNSELVLDSKAGITLPDVPDAKIFAQAIREVNELDYDSKSISNYTIKNHNWDLICKELLDHCNQLFTERSN